MENFKLKDSQKSGFNAPDGYFDRLPQMVFAKIEEKPVLSLFQRNRKYIMAAAAVLILALMLPVYNALSTKTELDEATIESYLAYHSGMTQFDLLTEMNPEDLAEMETTLPIEDAVIEEMLTTNSNFEQLLIE